MRISSKDSCPYCDSVHIFRIPRKFYMRISPLVKHYECDLCRQEFILYEKHSTIYSEDKLKRSA
jgi:transposase-like protein